MSDVAEQLPGRGKRSLVAMAIGVVALACTIAGLIWLRPRQVAVVPYSDVAELRSALNGLPIIGLPEPPVEKSVWRQYETVAFRINVTSPEIVRPALSQFANDPKRAFFAEVKPMILLRVCFEPPKSGKYAPQITQGWFGVTATSPQPTVSHRLSWPVGRRFGSFYLKEFVDGYQGPGPDPVVEYEWMLAHCEKRRR